MLYEGAKNGAELMDAIESMTRGRWRPSPGSVYPLLENMAEERIVKKRDDGRYELTAQARRDFETPWTRGEAGARGGPEETLTELEGYASYFEELAQAKPEEWDAIRPRVAAIAARWKKLAEK
jgi:DNA-binding PadR family transcriptional regulator